MAEEPCLPYYLPTKVPIQKNSGNLLYAPRNWKIKFRKQIDNFFQSKKKKDIENIKKIKKRFGLELTNWKTWD